MGRRTSLSHAQSLIGTYSGNSPTARPSTRRRESSDIVSANSLTSPIGNSRFSKEDFNVSSPPPSLLRRRTDYKENASGSGLDDRDEENLKPGSVVDPVVSFGPLKRTSTGPAGTGVNGPSSPWSATPQSAGFSPMGAFGNFSLGGPSSGQAFSPTDKKPTIGSFRGESRFKGLMNTENSEETTKVKEKASSTNLEKLTEVNNEQTFANWPAGSVRHRRSDEKYGTGSAALGGDDASPPTQHSSRAKTAENQSPYDGIGFSSLGLSSDVTNLREVVPRRDYSQSIMTNQTQNYLPSNEPMSPTSTNPFQSPEGEKAIHEDFETDESELHSTHFVNTRPFSQHARGIQTQHEGTASDRSQTSSVGAPRSYPNLGALGALSGMSGAGAWSAGPGAIGTPTRTLSGHPGGFGETVFHPLSDFTSPAHMNASVLGTGPSGGIPPIALGSAGPIGRGSKMGSLFPSAMQDQMRGDSARQESGFGDGNELYQRNLGNLNAPGFVSGLQDTENSIRSGRGTLDDLFGNLDLRNRHAQGASATFGGNDNVQTSSGPIPTSMLSQQPFPATSTFIGSPTMAVSSSGSYFSRAQDQDTTAALSNQMPALQQRKMVMPDRMRWIYRDPQGNTQGPWSGLEMHDWYKAGFFSPELQVKKLEDADYEPLAQLIRRIGNSREPFLVPQIGIPHGSVAIAPGVNVSASGALSASTPSALQTSAAQPPFPSSFPSFGTTLTAEQQNALERRKQEEQYLMARQKEHLAQQQNLMKQMQHMQSGSHGLHGQQLHHHSSAHSLQSQPSYGSITSPTGYQPTPTQGPIQMPPAIPGFFDSRNMPSNLGPLGGGSEALGPVREDEVTGIIDRLNTGRGGQVSFGGPPYHPGQPEGLSHSQQVAAMLQERARLQHEQEQYDLLKRSADNQGNSERLEQFHMLRSQVDEQPQQHSQSSFVGGHMGRPVAETDNSNQQQKKETAVEPPKQIQSLPPPPPKAVERPSLSEQVQKAAALAKQSPNAPPPQSPWAKVDIGLPQPFPPPQSSSPLPAPAAQRNRHNVAETLSAESRSQSQTPSVETPNTAIAPWAKDLTDPSKGPSLKEIQAIEARKAAQQEEIAAATRRAAAEQERQNQVQPAAPTPGLPSSANWASGVSPAVPMTPGVSAWTKPVAGKAPTVPASTSTKKTLAQIQKEEEARKTRAAAASAAANAASNSSNLLAMAGGKRYADLASKSTLTTQGGNSAWTTVGAGGKVKTPAGPAPNVSNRSLGTTTQPTLAPAKPKVTAPTRGGVVGSVSNQQLAADEFQKWTKSALGKGLNTGIPGKFLSFAYYYNATVRYSFLGRSESLQKNRKKKQSPDRDTLIFLSSTTGTSVANTQVLLQSTTLSLSSSCSLPNPTSSPTPSMPARRFWTAAVSRRSLCVVVS